MKNIHPSQWAGTALLLLLLVSLFLPWIRIQPASAAGMVERLAGREEGWVYDYLIMPSRDWRAMWEAPSTGVSGYQLILWAEDESYEGALARTVSGILWGGESGRLWMRLLVLGPLLGLAGWMVLLLRPGAGRWPWLIGAALVFYYAGVRWKMATALSSVLVAELVWNIGLWVHLYAGLLIGLCVLARSIAPRSKF